MILDFSLALISLAKYSYQDYWSFNRWIISWIIIFTVAQCVTYKIKRIVNYRNGYQKSNTISLVNLLPWPFNIYEYKSHMVVKVFKSLDKWFTSFLVIISSYWFCTAIASVCVLPAQQRAYCMSLRFVALVCKASRVRAHTQYSRGEAQVSCCGWRPPLLYRLLYGGFSIPTTGFLLWTYF